MDIGGHAPPLLGGISPTCGNAFFTLAGAMMISAVLFAMMSIRRSLHGADSEQKKSKVKKEHLSTGNDPI
jgi:hypothetical protein